MRLKTLLKNRKVFFLITACIVLIVILLMMRYFIPEQYPLKLIIAGLLSPYLSLAESIADNVIKLMVDGITIQNHKLFFTTYPEYFQKNNTIIENWTDYLLYLKWSVFLFLSFWLVQSTLKKKIKYTFFLLLAHFFAVVSGLVMLGGIGPLIVNPDSLSNLPPHIIGAIIMFILFAIWVKDSKSDIELALSKIKINFNLPDKKINEILFIFFLFILLKNFVIPFINYYTYIDLILRATKSLVQIFGYHAEINGPHLAGTNGGTLFMAKWCLGFISMFIFSAMVFLTRRNNKTCWGYILFGIIILHIVNIIRLSLLFIFVQNHDDSELIMDHHDMYNIIVYLLIFLLWIIWFEKFTLIKKSTKR